jgi:hypothetical protein
VAIIVSSRCDCVTYTLHFVIRIVHPTPPCLSVLFSPCSPCKCVRYTNPSHTTLRLRASPSSFLRALRANEYATPTQAIPPYASVPLRALFSVLSVQMSTPHQPKPYNPTPPCSPCQCVRPLLYYSTRTGKVTSKSTDPPGSAGLLLFVGK